MGERETHNEEESIQLCLNETYIANEVLQIPNMVGIWNKKTSHGHVWHWKKGIDYDADESGVRIEESKQNMPSNTFAVRRER